MITHLVLYRPRPGLDAEAREGFASAIALAQREIPAIRRFRVGRRLTDGPPYKAGPFPEFPYVGLIEFDDRAGLLSYLQHPMHEGLGSAFGSTLEAALVYDFETVDGSEASAFLLAE